MSLTTLGVGIATGLGLGSVYALIAVSFTLVIASTNYFNFALESVVSLGAIGAYVLAASLHLPIIPTLIIVCLGGAVAGALLDFIAHRPFEDRASNVGLAVLLASIGISIAIDAAAGLLFGTTPRSVPTYVSPSPIVIDKVAVNPAYIVMVVAVIIVAASLELVFRRTSIGRLLRATQGDREGAALLGENVNRVTTGVFAASGLIAGLAGFLITPITSASPSVGTTLVVPAFAALAIGGFGSFRGALGGGLAVGLIGGIVPLYANPQLVNPILLGVIFLVLVARPHGLFGKSAAREL